MDNNILDLLNIELELEINHEDEAELVAKNFLDNMGKVLDYVSEKEKQVMFEIFCSNIEYEKIGDKKMAYFDFYDSNTMRLYYLFAEYVITGIEPDFTKLDIFFRKSSIQEFEELKNGKHRTFRLPIPSLDFLLDLINKNGIYSLTLPQKQILEKYSKENL